MRLSFPTLGQVEENSTVDRLALQQMRLLDKKLTALIEVSLDSPQRLLIFYAHGGQAGAYLNDGESFRPVSAVETISHWTGGARAVRVIPLPDKAARAAWMAAASTPRDRRQGSGEASFSQFQQSWKRARIDGLIEIISGNAQGFVMLRQGEIVDSESSWITATGARSAPDPSELKTTWEAFVLETPPADTTQQCFTLRRAAHSWSKAIFESYQNIAGEKFLHVMLRELQSQVAPWKWNIRVDQTGLADEHFFPGAAASAHAYRALFMGTGAQMGLAIGSYLAQRILNDMFKELNDEERSMLEEHRLIPAAFSE